MDQLSQIQQDGKPLLRGQNAELFNETCALHKGNRFVYLCIDSVKQDYAFKCKNCVIDEDIKQYSLISLKQVVHAQEETKSSNFPLTDITLAEKINQITQKTVTSEALKLQIDQYFKDLIATILAKIESVQSNMNAKAESISNLSGEISSIIAVDFDTPLQIKEQVVRQLEEIDIFLIKDIENSSKMINQPNKHFDTSKTVSSLMNLVKNKFNDVSEDSCSKFQEQLNRMGFELSSLEVPAAGPRYAHLQSLTQNQTNEIAKLVEQLAIINQKSDNQFPNINEELSELKSDELFELIRNQTNVCSAEYLHDLKIIFEMLRGVFGLFHTHKLNSVTQEPNSFNHLSKAQLKSIQKLAAKVNELTESYGDQYQLSNQPQQQVQSNSNKVFQHLKDSKFNNMSVEESQNITRDFDKLLVNFPIFETLPTIQIERTLPPMMFTRSDRGSSSKMGITYNGGEVQLTLDAGLEGQCNSLIQDNNKGYSLKLTFNRPFGSTDGFRIGLIPNFLIRSQWVLSDSTSAGFCSELDRGASKVIRGNKLTSEGLRNGTSSLEFRWCVVQRQFFYSDATYSNINQVDENYFSPTGQYSFAVFFNEFAESDWSVTIKDFKEIDPNDVDKFN